MYVDEKNLPEHHKTFWELVKDRGRSGAEQKADAQRDQRKYTERPVLPGAETDKKTH